MVPNTFISSPIQDLHYLRDAIKELVESLGYNPIMSENDGVPFLPNISVEQACYKAVSECQLFVSVIGKRYGAIMSNGLSISHNEFRAAIEHGIPVFTLIDQEVLTYKKVFASNPGAIFPDMDNAKKTFELIDAIKAAPVNNAYTSFSNVQGVANTLRRQLASLFKELLREKYNPMNVRLNEILSEIKALNLRGQGKTITPEEFDKFRKTTRWLIDNDFNLLATLIKTIVTNFDDGILEFMSSDNLDQLISKLKFMIKIKDVQDIMVHREFQGGLSYSSLPNNVPPDILSKYPDQYISFSTLKASNEVVMNSLTKEYLDFLMQSIKSKVTNEITSGPGIV